MGLLVGGSWRQTRQEQGCEAPRRKQRGRSPSPQAPTLQGQTHHSAGTHSSQSSGGRGLVLPSREHGPAASTGTFRAMSCPLLVAGAQTGHPSEGTQRPGGGTPTWCLLCPCLGLEGSLDGFHSCRQTCRIQQPFWGRAQVLGRPRRKPIHPRTGSSADLHIRPGWRPPLRTLQPAEGSLDSCSRSATIVGTAAQGTHRAEVALFVLVGKWLSLTFKITTIKTMFP